MRIIKYEWSLAADVVPTSSVSSLITVHSHTHIYTTLPTTDTVTVGRRGFYYAGPAIWNSLPPHMTDMSMSLFGFRKLLKTFLFH